MEQGAFAICDLRFAIDEWSGPSDIRPSDIRPSDIRPSDTEANLSRSKGGEGGEQGAINNKQ
jgi:hypothetical protein